MRSHRHTIHRLIDSTPKFDLACTDDFRSNDAIVGNRTEYSKIDHASDVEAKSLIQSKVVEATSSGLNFNSLKTVRTFMTFSYVILCFLLADAILMVKQ